MNYSKKKEDVACYALTSKGFVLRRQTQVGFGHASYGYAQGVSGGLMFLDFAQFVTRRHSAP